MRACLILFALCFLAGCDGDVADQTKKINLTVPQVEANESTYCNNFGQYVEIVNVDDFRAWCQGHKDYEIVSISSVSMTSGFNSNHTSGFVVVYKKGEKK